MVNMINMINKKTSSQLMLKTGTVLFVLLLLLIIPQFGLAAPDQVISNSADWRDVYSTMVYSELVGSSGLFLTSTPHGPILLYEIPKTRQNIEIITSADKPYVVGYESLIRSRGYENPEEFIYEEANLELAKRLPGVNKFLVIDDSYGYNAIAVAPYAVRAGYYVLFVDDRNIGDILDFLGEKNIEDIIIYGHVDREVRTDLAIYNPEIINSDTGRRYEHNMLMIDKFSEIGSTKQVLYR